MGGADGGVPGGGGDAGVCEAMPAPRLIESEGSHRELSRIQEDIKRIP